MSGPAAKKAQPIVVKRIKKAAHGHHGGAWKIAYADFVTAMMAFFLLMWLLGSTTKGDLEGISDYFSTPLKVAMEGGSGSGFSQSVIKGGGRDLTRTVGQVQEVDAEKGRRRPSLNAARLEVLKADRMSLSRLKRRVEEAIARTPKLAELADQIRLEMTSDGLLIQIVDSQKRPMFASGSPVVNDYMRELLRSIGGLLNDVDNPVSLTGHTDSAPYAGGARGYSNWELSTDRANASRRELISGGMAPARVLRVSGLGDVVPLDKLEPSDPMNRRIGIVVLNHAAQQRILRGSELETDEAGEVARVISGESTQGDAAAIPTDPATR